MSIASLLDAIVIDLPDEERRILTQLGPTLDAVAEGHHEQALRGLDRARRTVRQQLGGGSGWQAPEWDDIDHMLDTDPPPADMILPGLKPGSVGLISGQGAVGKSMLTLAAILGVVTGSDLFGQWTVGNPGDVVYLYAEEDPDDLHRRLRAQTVAANLQLGRAERDRIHTACLAVDPPKLLTRRPDGVAQRTEDVIGQLEARLDAITNLRLIIVDPLVKFHTLEENSNGDMAQLMEFFTKWAVQYHAAVILVHHTAKGGDGKSQDAVRGASSIVNEARWQVAVNVLDEKTAELLGIDPEQRRWHITVETPKINHAAPLPVLLLQKGPGGALSCLGPLADALAQAKTTKAAKQHIATIAQAHHQRKEHANDQEDLFIPG